MALATDLEDGLEGARLGGATGAEGDGEELRLQLGQLGPGAAQLVGAFGGLRREEFDGDGARVSHLLQIQGK